MGKITLITGGARSGKSAHAIKLAQAYRGARRFFLATATASDPEMAARIERHRADRTPDIVTVEEPVNLVPALKTIGARADLVVIDCLTLWVANLMSVYVSASDDPFLNENEILAAALGAAPFSSILVTGEVGDGVVPGNPIARRFRDLLGWTNQRIAHAADEVILMVAGYPIKVK